MTLPSAHPVRGQVGWALYDWAASPFSTLIVTFVFAAYFQQQVVGDPVAGQAMWSTTLAVAGLGVALLAPFLGALADASGARKPWIAALTLVGAAASGALWFVAPDRSYALLALGLVVLANLGVEFGAMFANALLPDLAGPRRIGRLSGWAWALGYAGGLAALVLALGVLIRPAVPPFGLDPAAAEHVRLVGPLVGVWLVVFALPLLVFTPDRPRRRVAPGAAVRAGLKGMKGLLKGLPGRPDLLRFLIANMLYNNGLLTLFGLGGVYAAGQFGMTLEEVVGFGIALNVAAGIGAFGFGFFDDRIGSRATVLTALAGLIAAGSLAVAAPSETILWVAGCAIGLFVGPVQAASRSLMARMAPGEGSAAHFGLFALSGRITAFLGPAFAAAATAWSGSQRVGMATILLFLGSGFALLLWGVKEPGRER